MSVQSMACPKCGTWATEYDEGKWQCLNHKCQIKFLDKPDPSINVTNQSIVSINGSSLYDLDLSEKEEHRINHIQYVPSHKIFISIFILLILAAVILWPIGFPIDYKISSYVFIVALALANFWFYFLDAIECENAEKIEYYSFCPYCNHEFLSRIIIPNFDNGAGLMFREYVDSGVLGLHHCEKCGKQIMVKEDYTCGLNK